MSPFQSAALDLANQQPSGGTLASQRPRKRLTLPPMTQESHLCIGGKYETTLTPWGEGVIVFGMFFLALAVVYLGLQWTELSDWAAVAL